MYTDELTTMRRDQSQDQGQQRVEYWRWRIFDEFRNRWNDTQHLITETDALVHHRVDRDRAIESLGAAPPTWPNELSPHRQTVRRD